MGAEERWSTRSWGGRRSSAAMKSAETFGAEAKKPAQSTGRGCLSAELRSTEAFWAAWIAAGPLRCGSLVKSNLQYVLFRELPHVVEGHEPGRGVDLPHDGLPAGPEVAGLERYERDSPISNR